MVIKAIYDLHLTEDDVKNFFADCTKNDDDEDPRITKEGLYAGFHHGSLVEKQVIGEIGHGPKNFNTQECTRDELLAFLEHEDESMDALCSLPITMLAFALFFVLVQYHLSISSSYAMQSAIFDEVEGEGRPFIGTYIHDVPSFWEC